MEHTSPFFFFTTQTKNNGEYESDRTIPRTITSIQTEIEFLTKRHGRLLGLEDAVDKKSKRKSKNRFLDTRHIVSDFHGNYASIEEDDECCPDEHFLALFHEFAITVCHAKVIPRKELFEAWAMALYVTYYFPSCPQQQQEDYRGVAYYKRVVDLCCGHGLVSWAILFLDPSRTRTAICIDKSIPKSCDILEQVMMERHPDIVGVGAKEEDEVVGEGPQQDQKSARRTRKRWHWVEGDICQNISTADSSSTVIVGVHCCGSLSDTTLDLAISSNSPLCLVPCCHTRKILPHHLRKSNELFDSMLQQNIEENNRNEQKHLPTTLTDYIDQSRIQKLIDAGFNAQEERIPSVITPKNRIIIATPTSHIQQGDSFGLNGIGRNGDNGVTCDEKKNEDDKPHSEEKERDGKKNKKRNSRTKKLPFVIPLADTPLARSIVEFQSGRVAANLRKRDAPTNLSLSLYLPYPENSVMTIERLNAFTNAVVKEHQSSYYSTTTNDDNIITTHVTYGEADGKVYSHPGKQLFSRSYHIRYEVNDASGSLPQVTKQQAKELHKIIEKRITERAFPGISLRWGIK